MYTVERRFPTSGGIAVEWSVTGTHRSDMFGIEPTGEVMTVDGINLLDVHY